ncbi:hypothetical protein ACFQV4_04810 [Streptomyces thermocarboxydus]
MRAVRPWPGAAGTRPLVVRAAGEGPGRKDEGEKDDGGEDMGDGAYAVLTALGVLGTGLVAGVLCAFSTFVMRGWRRCRRRGARPRCRRSTWRRCGRRSWRCSSARRC